MQRPTARRTVTLVLCALFLLMGLPAAAAKPPVPPGKPDAKVDLERLDSAVGQKLLPLALARGGGEIRLGGSEGRYLRAVFDDLAHSARKQRRLDYTLHVLSSRERVDAWALPDGSVFVTLGLLDRLSGPDEVAGVLAHQLAHAILRHNLDDLTSAEDRTLLSELAEGKKPVSRERLGRAGISILGEYYPTEEERSADSLAKDLLRLNGFTERLLEVSFRRLLDKPLPGYLMVHPHLDLKPLPREPEGPSVVIIQPAPPVHSAPPPPPSHPAPAPVPAFVPTPEPHLQRPATPARRTGLSLVAGVYPNLIESSTATVTFYDDEGTSLAPLTLRTGGTQVGPAAGALFEIPFSADWGGLVGGGWTGADVFSGRSMGHGWFALAGILRRGAVDGQGIRWAAGPYAGYSSLYADVGRVSEQLYFDAGDYVWSVEPGSNITAAAGSVSLGGLFSLSGDTPAAGVSWFATLAGQVATKGDWSFSSTSSQTGESVKLPFDGQGPAPLSATGAMALGGVVFHF